LLYTRLLAILVAAHLYFSRCARERERSERERCASSRVPFAMFRARSFSKKVVKRLGFALTDFVPENLKTKMQGTPVGAWF
jgi:hypothetical protein